VIFTCAARQKDKVYSNKLRNENERKKISM